MRHIFTILIFLISFNLFSKEPVIYAPIYNDTLELGQGLYVKIETLKDGDYSYNLLVTIEEYPDFFYSESMYFEKETIIDYNIDTLTFPGAKVVANGRYCCKVWAENEDTLVNYKDVCFQALEQGKKQYQVYSPRNQDTLASNSSMNISIEIDKNISRRYNYRVIHKELDVELTKQIEYTKETEDSEKGRFSLGEMNLPFSGEYCLEIAAYELDYSHYYTYSTNCFYLKDATSIITNKNESLTIIENKISLKNEEFLKLVNINGQEININSKNNQLDISRLNTGLYILITDKNTYKIIKE